MYFQFHPYKSSIRIILDVQIPVSISFLWEGAKGDIICMNNVNLENTQLTPRMGGLGIGSIKYRKSTVLAKWIWHFLCEERTLWRKIAEAKHYPTLSNHQ